MANTDTRMSELGQSGLIGPFQLHIRDDGLIVIPRFADLLLEVTVESEEKPKFVVAAWTERTMVMPDAKPKRWSLKFPTGVSTRNLSELYMESKNGVVPGTIGVSAEAARVFVVGAIRRSSRRHLSGDKPPHLNKDQDH